MLTTPKTRCIECTVFQIPLPEDVSYVAIPRAFVRIEFLEDSLSATAKKLMDLCDLEKLHTLLRDPLVALTNKLVDQSWTGDYENGTNSIDLQVLRIESHPGNIPGIYTEISTSTSVAGDIIYWTERDVPLPSVIAHINIEFFVDALTLEARKAIACAEKGEPETLEKLLDCGNLPVFKKWSSATERVAKPDA